MTKWTTAELFNTQVIHNKRLPWIDYAKAIAIILVVYRHVLIGFTRADIEINQFLLLANEVVYTFRMPLFFILTGIFIRRSISKRGNRSFVRNKAITLLYPYFIWGGLQISLQVFLSDHINADRSWIDYSYLLIRPRAIDQFWFLYAMFNTSVVFLLAFRIWKGRVGGLLLTGIALHCLSTWLIGVNVAYDVAYYFLFIAIGDYLASFIFQEQRQPTFASFRLTLLLLPLFILSQWVWLHYEKVNVFAFALIALVGCALMLNLSFLLARYRVFPYLRVFGYHSLYIYIMHVIISAAVRVFLINVVGITHFGVLFALCLVLAVVLPIVIYNALLKMGGWFLFTPQKPRPQPQRLTPS